MVEAVSNKNYVIKGTATAAVIGAGVSAGLNAGAQKLLLKYPKQMLYIPHIYRLKQLRAADKIKPSGHLEEAVKNAKETFKRMYAFVKAGKMDWKIIGKESLKSAAWVGGIYLAYRSIKALFSKNDK